MKKLFIFISIFILIISILIINTNTNTDTNTNTQAIYTSLPDSQKTKQKNAEHLIKKKQIDCNNGCPTDKNDNKLYKVYTLFSDKRHLNKYFIKNKKGASSIGPANIFIMRHAERINGVIPLDCNGIYRSSYTANLIEEINKLGYGIDYIVTANADLTHASMHLQQTVFAASWILDIPLFIFGSEKESQLAVNNIYNNAIFNNKNILFCWEHSCIQQLLLNIISIGTSAKKIPNKAFINKQGKLALPYWGKNNYQTIIHFDEEFHDNIYSSGLKTCYKKDNETLTFGKQQICGDT